MYIIRFSEGLKPIDSSFTRAIVKRGKGGYLQYTERQADGWYMVDPMRFERYAHKAREKREKQVQNSRSYVFAMAKPQIVKRPSKPKKISTRKRTMHNRSKFMKANVFADPIDVPPAGELIQPLRSREWPSEVFIPLAQSFITGILVTAGAGIILAVSSELLGNIQAGVLEFAIIGGAAWLLSAIRRLVHYSFVDSVTESLPAGLLAFIGTAGYYTLVTAPWFEFWQGAAAAGTVGFFAMALQWGGFMQKADDLLYVIERVAGIDIDGDGSIGDLPVEPGGVRSIPLNHGQKKEAVEIDNPLPVHSRVWQSFAVAVLFHKCNISKNSICKLTGENSWKYPKISQPNYGAIYRYCEKNGYIATDSTTGSNTLSVKGWEELSRWLPSNMPPNLPHPSQAVN